MDRGTIGNDILYPQITQIFADYFVWFFMDSRLFQPETKPLSRGGCRKSWQVCTQSGIGSVPTGRQVLPTSTEDYPKHGAIYLPPHSKVIRSWLVYGESAALHAHSGPGDAAGDP